MLMTYVFFYSTFRYHLWAHIAADASLKMSDSETEGIIIKRGRKKMSVDTIVKMYVDLLEEAKREGQRNRARKSGGNKNISEDSTRSDNQRCETVR